MRDRSNQALIPPNTTHATSETSLFNLRWAQIQSRQPNSRSPSSLLNPFIYAVLTTKIYCLPDCPSRKPRRSNVKFFNTRTDAVEEGFRPCKRCKPDQNDSGQMADEGKLIVEKACAYLDRAVDKVLSDKYGSGNDNDKDKDNSDGNGDGDNVGDEKPDTPRGNVKLVEVANIVGLSPRYFHGLFKRVTGLTPAEYYNKALLQKRTRTKQPDEQQGVSTDDNQISALHGWNITDTFDNADVIWDPNVDFSLIDPSPHCNMNTFTMPDYIQLNTEQPECFDSVGDTTISPWHLDQYPTTTTTPSHLETNPTASPYSHPPPTTTTTRNSIADHTETTIATPNLFFPSPDLLAHSFELYDRATYAKLDVFGGSLGDDVDFDDNGGDEGGRRDGMRELGYRDRWVS